MVYPSKHTIKKEGDKSVLRQKGYKINDSEDSFYYQ